MTPMDSAAGGTNAGLPHPSGRGSPGAGGNDPPPEAWPGGPGIDRLDPTSLRARRRDYINAVFWATWPELRRLVDDHNWAKRSTVVLRFEEDGRGIHLIVEATEARGTPTIRLDHLITDVIGEPTSDSTADDVVAELESALDTATRA